MRYINGHDKADFRFVIPLILEAFYRRQCYRFHSLFESSEMQYHLVNVHINSGNHANTSCKNLVHIGPVNGVKEGKVWNFCQDSATI